MCDFFSLCMFLYLPQSLEADMYRNVVYSCKDGQIDYTEMKLWQNGRK